MKEILTSLAISFGLASVIFNIFTVTLILPELKNYEEKDTRAANLDIKKTDLIFSLVRPEVGKIMRQPDWQCSEDIIPLPLPKTIPLEATMNCTPEWSEGENFHINIWLNSKEIELSMSQHGPYKKPK